MRVLRSSAYSPALKPLTTVMRDSDVIDTLESIRAGIPREDDVLVITDLFEMEDGVIEAATHAALARLNRDEERNMAILYFWATMTLRSVTDEGMLVMPAPAPLSEEQVRAVFEQIVQHSAYRHQHVEIPAADGTRIVIEDGVIA